MKSAGLLLFLLVMSFAVVAYSQVGEVGDTSTASWRELTEYEPSREVVQEVIDSATGIARGESEEAPAQPEEYEPSVVPAAEGSGQARLVDAAADLVMRYRKNNSFPYDGISPRVGCALVVNRALDDAGLGIPNHTFESRVRVSWREQDHPNGPEDGTMDRLLEHGWVEVTPPPYSAGDIITWNTTGSGGGGPAEAGTRQESHIGIIMASGNNVMAMSNSSEHARPRIHPAEYRPVVRVLRRAS